MIHRGRPRALAGAVLLSALATGCPWRWEGFRHGQGDGGTREDACGPAPGDNEYARIVTAPGCTACSAAVEGDSLRATIPSGADGMDSAYGVRELGGATGWSGEIFLRDEIRFEPRPPVGANLVVLHLRDALDRVAFEVFVRGSNGRLAVFVADGSLSASRTAPDANVVVPLDGRPILFEASILANRSVLVRVDGRDALTIPLSGGTAVPLRTLRVGVDHYDAATGGGQVTVYHRAVNVSADGWLGPPCPR